MIGYTTFGSNDIQKSAKFYDEVLALLDAQRVFDHEGFIGWTTGEGQPLFAIAKPFNGNEATVGNGTMIALKANDASHVQQVHEKAMALGAVNEGDPGVRAGTFFCAYFRDLDGNKLNVFCQVDE